MMKSHGKTLTVPSIVTFPIEKASIGAFLHIADLERYFGIKMPLNMQAVNFAMFWKYGWVVGLFLLLPLGAYGIRETLRFTSVS
jgi:hypothetical protein